MMLLNQVIKCLQRKTKIREHQKFDTALDQQFLRQEFTILDASALFFAKAWAQVNFSYNPNSNFDLYNSSQDSKAEGFPGSASI